jgi:hypothetical protein
MLNNAFSFNWIEKNLLPKSKMLRPLPIINIVVEGHRLTVSTIVAVIRLPSHSTAHKLQVFLRTTSYHFADAAPARSTPTILRADYSHLHFPASANNQIDMQERYLADARRSFGTLKNAQRGRPTVSLTAHTETSIIPHKIPG